MRRGLDVIVIEKGAFGQEAASGLNRRTVLDRLGETVETMLAELTARSCAPASRRAARLRGSGGSARSCAAPSRDVSDWPRSDHDYNLRASVQHGAVMAAMNERRHGQRQGDL